jgi:hypothetical protein
MNKINEPLTPPTPPPAPKKEEPNVSPPAAPRTEGTPLPVGNAPNTPPPAPRGGNEGVDNTDGNAGKNSPPAAQPPDNVPRSRQQWDEAKEKIRTPLQNEINEWKSKFEATNAELTTLKASPQEDKTSKAELERLTKQNEEYSETIQRLGVTEHPQFKKFYDNKVTAQIELAKRIVGADNSEVVEKILKLPDIEELSEVKSERLNNLIESLSPIQQSRLGSVINELEQISVDRAADIALAKEKREKFNADQEASRKDASTRARGEGEKLFNSIIKEFQDPKNGFDTYKLKDGDEAWNKDVASRIAEAKSLFLGDKKANPQEVAQAILHAASLPIIIAGYRDVLGENEKLREQVKKLSAANPGLPAGGGPEGGGNGDPKVKVEPGASPQSARNTWVDGLMKASR